MDGGHGCWCVYCGYDDDDGVVVGYPFVIVFMMSWLRAIVVTERRVCDGRSNIIGNN